MTDHRLRSTGTHQNGTQERQPSYAQLSEEQARYLLENRNELEGVLEEARVADARLQTMLAGRDRASVMQSLQEQLANVMSESARQERIHQNFEYLRDFDANVMPLHRDTVELAHMLLSQGASRYDEAVIEALDFAGSVAETHPGQKFPDTLVNETKFPWLRRYGQEATAAEKQATQRLQEELEATKEGEAFWKAEAKKYEKLYSEEVRGRETDREK